MAKYFVESSEIVIYRTEVEAETPQEAVEKIESSNGDIVDRIKDVSIRYDLEAFAVYDEDGNEAW